ncbi:MAG: carboxypeptidase regulatory-like domain-containing protein [Vicinamibacterales bacterium]
MFARRCLKTFAILFVSAVPALAGQAGNPASITGVITDSSGAVLPGVTVTATSPALQVPSVTSVSDERGEYRLSPLPIGVYSVVFELPGFQNVRREGVQLTVGFTARVDTQLSVGALAETVTVSGASPLVDTTSTATSTELTREQVEVLPSSRDGFHAFLSQTPGVRTNLDVGSSGLGDTVVFRFYGQVGSPWQMVEGVVTSAPTFLGAQGSHVDFNAMEGTRVQTVGSNAEMPRRGLLVDSVFKSGGNDFHGSLVLYGSGSALEANNIDDNLRAQGIRLAKLHTVQDFAGTLGGRIIRNKLWFFGGYRYQQLEREILDAFDPDGTPILNVKGGRYHFEKVSYQMSPAHRFTGVYHWTNDLEVRNASRFVPRESMEDKDNPVWIGKVEWQTVRGSALVASVQYGRWNFRGDGFSTAPGKVSTLDIATLFRTGDNFTINGRDQDDNRHHTKGVVTYYKPDLLGGNHEFKVGVDHLASYFNDGYRVIGENNQFGYQLVFNNGVPFQINTRNTPAKGRNLGSYVGVYGQDSWTLARRLTLDLGLRFEHDAAHAPAQCRAAARFATAQCFEEFHLVTFDSLAPRAHVAFDVTGDGKTVLKGGYGRFNQLRELQPDLTNINRNVPATTTWDWHDRNGNRLFEDGEVNFDPNGPDFRSVAAIGSATLGVVNPNEKQPTTDEFSATFERELIANTAVRVTGVYVRNRNTYVLSDISREGQYTIPITNLDPGPDGRLGTADDMGRSITYYEYPARLAGAAFASAMFTDSSAADANFKTFEVAVTKRPSQGWQIGASYSSTWHDSPIGCSDTGIGLGNTNSTVWYPVRCANNPNQAFNTANNTREWQAKMSGAYNLPYGIAVSGNYGIGSGAPQARQVLFTGGQTIRSIVLNVEPLGTFYLPNTHLMDVRAAKRVNLGGARSVELRFDIYNVLNKGTVRTQTLQSGANYRRPATILFPRILQIGATLNF